jgi:hypothetical protein
MMRTTHCSVSEYLVWEVFNRSCLYAHEATKEWDRLLDSPDKFLVLCTFGEFISAKSEEYWLDFATRN